MRQTCENYDVIIVGGRPAGAALAIRLASRGMTVLVVDKASFPSAPEVPSCPVIYPSVMHLLDELGIGEDLYAHAAIRINRGMIEFDGHFQAPMQLPPIHGRTYIYGLDRASFDHVLWKQLGQYPSISAREQCAVTELIRDDTGRVVGIEASERGRAKATFYARLCVVGADGRHSFVARKAGAEVVLDAGKRTSTVHFAEWEGIGSARDERDPLLHIVSGGRGKNAIFFPSVGGRVRVATHVRTDRAEIRGDVEAYYLGTLRSLGAARRRLEGARQVGPILGLRKVANRYLAHGGPGWVLVGDALHHKDPVDGQGIYDALIEGKRLAELLSAVHAGSLSWEQALVAYERAVTEETGAMFRETMKRLELELFQDLPTLAIRTLVRWLLQDPEYQRRLVHFLARATPPAGWLSPSLALGAFSRGAARDLLTMFRSRGRLQAGDVGLKP